MQKQSILREICKFLSGSFFVTAGASWYFAWLQMPIPFAGFTLTPEFLWLRGGLHFSLFLLTLYLGFIRQGGQAIPQNSPLPTHP